MANNLILAISFGFKLKSNLKPYKTKKLNLYILALRPYYIEVSCSNLSTALFFYLFVVVVVLVHKFRNVISRIFLRGVPGLLRS